MASPARGYPGSVLVIWRDGLLGELKKIAVMVVVEDDSVEVVVELPLVGGHHGDAVVEDAAGWNR